MVARVFSHIFSFARKVVVNVGILLLICLGLSIAVASALAGAVGAKVIAVHLYDPLTQPTLHWVISAVLFAAVGATTTMMVVAVMSDRPKWRK